MFTPPGEKPPDRTLKRSKTRRAVPMSDRYRRLLEGEMTVDDLDDEEILRGMLRDKNGSFKGSPPRVVPHTMHAALRSAMETRAQRRLAAAMPEVLDELVKVATGKRFGAGESQVKAAALIMDRVFGKVPDKVDTTLTVTAKWEEAATAGRLFVDIESAPIPQAISTGQQSVIQDVVEAELVDVDEPERTQLEVDLEVEPEVQKPRRASTGVKL